MRTRPKFADSAEKVVEALALLQPRDSPIYLWPSIFRVLHCKEGCSWCCMRFTLDYIPEELALLPEAVRARFQPREVRGKSIWTLDQYQLSGCPFLKDQGWGCSLYPLAPISCMMAPQIHISLDTRVNGVAIYAKRFSRPTAKGFAPCEFCVPESDTNLRNELDRNIVLWKRLHSWATYFGFETVVPGIIRRLENPLILRKTQEVYAGTQGILRLSGKETKMSQEFVHPLSITPEDRYHSTFQKGLAEIFAVLKYRSSLGTFLERYDILITPNAVVFINREKEGEDKVIQFEDVSYDEDLEMEVSRKFVQPEGPRMRRRKLVPAGL